MSRKSKEKSDVKYRTRHKSLDHLTSNDTKHGFKKRLKGALQRQDAEPVYFGVSDFTVSSQDSTTNTFHWQPLNQSNYQEAANLTQRRSRTRSAPSSKSKAQSSRRRHDGSRTPVVRKSEGGGLLAGHPPQVLAIDDHMEPIQSTGTSPFLAPPPPPQYLPAHFTLPATPHASLSTNVTGVVVGPSMGGMGGVGIELISHGAGRSLPGFDQGSTSELNQPVAQPNLDYEIPRGYSMPPYWNIDSPIYCLPADAFTFNHQDWSVERRSG